MSIESGFTRLLNRSSITKDGKLPTVSTAECFTLSRKELIKGTGEEYTQLGEVALLTCLQRLAILPTIEGLAFSRIRTSGGLYYTSIERCGFSGDEEIAQTFRETTAAISTFGDALGEIMPGSFMNLPQKRTFASAVRYLKGKRRASQLDFLGVIYFIK